MESTLFRKCIRNYTFPSTGLCLCRKIKEREKTIAIPAPAITI